MPTLSAATGTVSVPRDRDPAYPVDEDGLPPSVLARYEALIEHRDAAFAALRASYERSAELKHDRIEAARELERLQAYADEAKLFKEHREVDPDTGAVKVIRSFDSFRLDAAKRAAERASERLERHLNAHEELAQAHNALARLTGRVESYIGANRRRLEVADLPPSPKLAKGETPATAVERVRARLSALARERKIISRTPVTVEEAKQKARAIVDKLANSGRPGVSGLFRSGNIAWPMATVPQHNVDGYTVRSIDGAALLAFALKPALIAALDKEIEAVGADINGALSEADRLARLHQIEEEVLALGYDEQAMIDAAAETGHVIIPRANADPRPVLGLSPGSPKPKE